MSAAGEAVLVRSRPRVSVIDYALEELKTYFRGQLEGRGVCEAHLFGSVVTGTAGAWSDVDLVVVVRESSEPFVERPRAFAGVLDLGLPVDILVYTREEFARLSNSDAGFWKEFRRHHVRLI